MEDNNPNIKEEKLNYQIGRTEYFNYVYYDDSNNDKRPGIIVIDEWWGLTDYGKRRARALVNLGYISMVVDMYGNGKTVEDPQSAGKLASVFYKDPSLAKKQIDVAIEHLKKYAQTEHSKIGAIGYCFGGFVVLNAAKLGSDLTGVVSFHGGLSGAKPDKNRMKAKVLVCHGADDPFENPNVENFKSEMEEAAADYRFIVYPGATHAFSNPKATAKGEKYNMPIKYNEEADERSWNEMKQFFEKLF
ncbi:MAG TPA: dienelactone hydrolase family protein [Hanamia sp.]|nr:dienelactone hydrolase family protein [Hanamia sp.]